MYNKALAVGGHVFTRWSTLVKKTSKRRYKKRKEKRKSESEWTNLTEENVFHAHLNKHKTTAV